MAVKTKEKSPKGKAKNGFFTKLKNFFSTLELVAELLTLTFYAVCAIYAIVVNQLRILNAVLLGITVTYAIFYIIQFIKRDKPAKARKKLGKKAYKFLKVAINLVMKVSSAVLIMYTALSDRDTASYLTLIFSIIAIIFTAVSLVFKFFNFLLSLFLHRTKKKATAALTETKEKVVATTKETAEKVKTATENTKSAIGAGIDKTKNAVVGTAKKAGSSIANTTKKAGNAIANTAKNAAEKAKNIAGGAKNAIGTAAGKVKSVFKNKDKPAIEAQEAEIAELPDANGGEE